MRLDSFLYENGYFDSRNKAQESITRGEVSVDGRTITKASFCVCSEVDIKISKEKDFVSVGGFKLEKALNDFNFSVENLIVADVGASTGGFCDCMLQRGIKKVFAVDINDDLLHKKLRNNDKVVKIIKNAKNLTLNDFDEKLDLITADLSFISATQVLQIFYTLLGDGKNLILLIKPQFEQNEKIKFKNGIIRDDKYRKLALKSVCEFAVSCGFVPLKMTTAPICDNKNVEFLVLFEKNKRKSLDFNFENFQ